MSTAIPRPHAFAPPLHPAAWLVLLLACALAPLLAYNQTPSATLYNQLIALSGWGAVLICLTMAQPRARGGAAIWALLLMCAMPWVAMRWAGLPLSLALSSSALMSAALLVTWAAQGLDEAQRGRWFHAFCWALLLAGLLSLAVSLVQVFMPEWANGKLIARSGIPGRAVGNMRQPNHLASLLMWSCVAAVFLADQGRVLRRALPVLLFGLVFGVVLSASRTGMLGVLILAVWGALDRKLQRSSRLALLATPVMLGVGWELMSIWSHAGGHAFGAESRLAEGAGSPSRIAILANAWELVKRHPLTGVGWGEFNLAWTMTPFPARPVAFFDHTHDLPMQLAVELGLPLSLFIMGLLCWALWRALRDSMHATGADAVVRRCAFMIVLMIGLHSLLEYPLWYAYFLLPAAFAFGVALGAPGAAARGSDALRYVLPFAGAVLITGSALAVWDYQRVVVIYAPSEGAAPLVQRIEEGQRAVFFATSADYAAATSLEPGFMALEATKRTAHNLIDARLMMAWAKSLHAVGDDDRARYVVQRLREFRSPTGDEWLKECDDINAGEPRLFQCDPPSRDYDWREMR